MERTKEESIAMIKGTEPASYRAAGYFEQQGWGKLSGFPNEKWQWDMARLHRASQDELLRLYFELKEKL